MAFEMILSQWTHEGFLVKEGFVDTFAVGSAGPNWEFLSSQAVPGMGGYGEWDWDSGFGASRDLWFIITDGTNNSTRTLRQFDPVSGNERIAYTLGNTSTIRKQGCPDGRSFYMGFNRVAGDRVQGYNPTRGLNVVPDLNAGMDANDKRGLTYDGSRFIPGRLSGTSLFPQEWNLERTGTKNLIFENSTSRPFGRDLEWNGARMLNVRTTIGGYRVHLFNRDNSTSIEPLFQSTPTAFDHVDCMTFDGNYIYVGWVTDSAGGGFPVYQ